MSGISAGFSFEHVTQAGLACDLPFASIRPDSFSLVKPSMPTLSEFSAQLGRCAQSPEEIRAFVDAFSKVRLRYIARAIAASQARLPPRAATSVTGPDWTDLAKLTRSGLKADLLVGDPPYDWLHVDVAADRAGREEVQRLLAATCLSDKQRKAIFPALNRTTIGPATVAARIAEVPRLNAWLAWSLSEGISPEAFGSYQKHLSIHGASQNAGGAVGAAGAAIAILDAIREVAPEAELDLDGVLPPHGAQDPVSVDTFLRERGIAPESSDRPLKSILLPSRRAVIFASDPDVAIIQSLGQPFRSAREAWSAYSSVRANAEQRSQHVMEFAVGEVKAATDASNLHERMALSTRETRSERQTDRFLMMAVLTSDILTGGTGESGRRNTRAPMQNREMGRMADVFNLHHAWGWDGGRQRHPEHWEWLKIRLRNWCRL